MSKTLWLTNAVLFFSILNTEHVDAHRLSKVVFDNSYETLRSQKRMLYKHWFSKGKKSHDLLIWTLFTGLIEVLCLHSFFLVAFPFVNTKLQWPINITWCGDAKQELMIWVCVWERDCVMKVPMEFCLDRQAWRGCGLAIYHSVDSISFLSYPLGFMILGLWANLSAVVLYCISLIGFILTVICWWLIFCFKYCTFIVYGL